MELCGRSCLKTSLSALCLNDSFLRSVRQPKIIYIIYFEKARAKELHKVQINGSTSIYLTATHEQLQTSALWQNNAGSASQPLRSRLTVIQQERAQLYRALLYTWGDAAALAHVQLET
jgi:hypothetical protein